MAFFGLGKHSTNTGKLFEQYNEVVDIINDIRDVKNRIGRRLIDSDLKILIDSLEEDIFDYQPIQKTTNTCKLIKEKIIIMIRVLNIIERTWRDNRVPKKKKIISDLIKLEKYYKKIDPKSKNNATIKKIIDLCVELTKRNLFKNYKERIKWKEDFEEIRERITFLNKKVKEIEDLVTNIN